MRLAYLRRHMELTARNECDKAEKWGLHQMHTYRGMNKKRRRTGASVSTQLRGNKQETTQKWGLN